MYLHFPVYPIRKVYWAGEGLKSVVMEGLPTGSGLLGLELKERAN